MKAYLILPAEYAVMRLSTVPDTKAFHATMIIDPSTRQEPSEQQKALFRKAMDMLRLTIEIRPIWTWADGRPTSERYSKTRRELASIEARESTETFYSHSHDERKFQQRQKRLGGMC